MSSTDKKHIKLKDLNIKSAGFSVPYSYFDNIETKIISKIKNDIPANYFEDVEKRILSKLNLDKPKKVKVIKLNPLTFKRLIPVVAAASVILFIALNFFNKTNTLNFNNLDSSSISNWIELNSDNANAYVLGEYLSSDDLTNIFNNNAANINESDLIEYLNDTNIEDLIIKN